MRIQIIAAVAAALTAAISSAALAGDAGVVETVAETAYGTAPSRTRMEKHAGDVVQHRELLETSTSGAMKVKFTDGSKLALGAGSKAFVVAYVYKPEQSVANAIVSLPEGSMRYVTGAMPKDHTTIYTPTATMLLNGADISVGVNDRGNTHLMVENGSVTVRSRTTGQQMVYNAGESVDITPTGITTSTAALQ
ncbi:FecR domain-containing protein [Dongia sedimenti]|uniref:FecR domain-containing protein n=1 Tax=Dongia sedimenti TaxID=3064282 RepID=A0ABU0YMW7_9PROT|nr:FecR domain-containing protein [Rhodospirillaceae bacterium R-7]